MSHVESTLTPHSRLGLCPPAMHWKTSVYSGDEEQEELERENEEQRRE